MHVSKTNDIFGQHGVLVEICHSRSGIVQHPDTLKSAAYEQNRIEHVECFVDISRCIFMLTQCMRIRMRTRWESIERSY